MAEHSYWVAVITGMLCNMKGLESSIYVMHALYHDMEEAITGDLPSPVKRGRSWKDVELAAFNEITGRKATKLEIDEGIHRVVKMADTVAALIVADEEVKMGNTFFTQIRAELIYAAFYYKDKELNDLLFELGFWCDDGMEPIIEMSHL